MSQLRKEINKIEGLVLQILYMWILYQVNLAFEYDNGFEFLVGMIVTTMIMNAVEFIVYRIAFERAGRYYCESSEMKVRHWFVRVALILVVFVISKASVCSIILTPVIKDCTQVAIDIMKGFTMYMSESMIKAFLS